MSRPQNVLALSSFSSLNRVFEDYCFGIEANSTRYRFIDYIKTYLELGAAGLEHRIFETIEAEQIDTVFFILWSSDMTFSLDFIERLASRVKIVMNFFDTEYFFENADRYYAQLADLVVLPDYVAKFKYEHLGIPAYTSFSLFDGRHYRKTDLEKDIDVSFVGNIMHADRKEHIEFLRASGIKVEVFGVGSANGFATFEQMIDVFNRSKINLNFTSTADSENYVVRVPSINQRIRQSKGRPIEIALCGGFVLTQRAPGIERMFEPDAEFVVFNNKQEMLDAVRHYLSDLEGAAAIAQSGHVRALQNYEVTRGFGAIFQRLSESRRDRTMPIYQDREFVRGVAAHRFFYLVNFVLAGRLRHAWSELAFLARLRSLPLRMSYYSAIKGLTFFARRSPKATSMLKKVRRRLGLRAKY